MVVCSLPLSRLMKQCKAGTSLTLKRRLDAQLPYCMHYETATGTHACPVYHATSFTDITQEATGTDQKYIIAWREFSAQVEGNHTWSLQLSIVM